MKKITFLFMLFSFIGFAQPDTAPTTPPQAQGDVVSVFSDAYTGNPTLTPTTFSQNNNTAAVVNLAGNDVYQFTIVDGDFQGFNLGSAIDLTAMENLHYDLWIEGSIPVGNVFNTTVSQHGGGHLTGQTAGYVHTNATLSAGQEGQWISFDIAFSSFGGGLDMNPRDIISQLVFSYTNFTPSDDIYIDNIYFWRNAVNTNVDASLSDLQVDGSTITGFAPTSLSYDIELPSGTTVVPTVTATATQAGMGSSSVNITPTASLPGTTTVSVTAPDGTTMQDYLVNFTVEVLDPTTGANINGSTGTDMYIYSGLSGNANQSDFTGFNLVDFNGALTVSEPVLGGDTVIRVDNLDFFGSGLGLNFDATGPYDFVHLSYYATTSTAFNFSLVDDSLSATVCCGNPAEPFYRIGGTTPDEAIVTGQWVSVFIPLSHYSDFNAGWDGTDIKQTLITGNGTVFIDNIFFSTTNVLSTDSFEASAFKVFPNPTNGDWNVSGTSVINNVTVYDILGKQVLVLEPNSNDFAINASSLRTGVYFAKIEAANGSKTIKLVRE